MGQTEPSYKGSLGEIDWLDDHEHSCLDVQCRATDFGSWTINIAMVHFGFLLVNKAREVGKNINGWRSILDNCLTLCETLKKASVDGPFYRNWLVSLMVFLELNVSYIDGPWVLGGTLNGHLFNCLILQGTKNRIRVIVFILVNAPFFIDGPFFEMAFRCSYNWRQGKAILHIQADILGDDKQKVQWHGAVGAIL